MTQLTQTLNLERSTSILKELITNNELMREMKEELSPAIEALDERKAIKTRLTDNLRAAILGETEDDYEGSYHDGKVTTYHQREVIILDERTAVRQIIEFADEYFRKTGVDIIASLLKVSKSGIDSRVLNAPHDFGLQPVTDVNGIVNHFSPGIEVKVIKKVRVANDV